MEIFYQTQERIAALRKRLAGLDAMLAQAQDAARRRKPRAVSSGINPAAKQLLTIRKELLACRIANGIGHVKPEKEAA